MSRVRIIIRIRPVGEKLSTKYSLKRIGEGDIVSLWSSNTENAVKEFLFDKVFDENASQNDLFEELCVPLSTKLLNGYNACILAYGQTNAGKTHTIFGADGKIIGEGRGILPRSLENVFSSVSESPSGNFELFSSFFEIHNDEVYDLGVFYSNVNKLTKHPLPTGQKLNLRKKMGKTEIEKLCIIPVDSLTKTMDLLAMGLEHRKIDPESSGSHIVFSLKIVNKREDYVGTVTFVDLIGSESHDHQSMDDLSGVNQGKGSLSALRRVIYGIHNHEEHVPFESSKLTRVLKNTLSGNTFTYVLGHINRAYYEESLNCLHFSHRCKNTRAFNSGLDNHGSGSGEGREELEMEEERSHLMETITILQKQLQEVRAENSRIRRNRKGGGGGGSLSADSGSGDIFSRVISNVGSLYDGDMDEGSGEYRRREVAVLTRKVEGLEEEVARAKRKSKMRKAQIQAAGDAEQATRRVSKERAVVQEEVIGKLREKLNALKKKIGSVGEELSDETEEKMQQIKLEFERKFTQYEKMLGAIPRRLKRAGSRTRAKKSERAEVVGKVRSSYSKMAERNLMEGEVKLSENERMYKHVIQNKDKEHKKMWDSYQELQGRSSRKVQELQQEIDLLYEYGARLSRMVHKMGPAGLYPIQMNFKCKTKSIQIPEEEQNYLRRMDVIKYARNKIPNSVNDFIHEGQVFTSLVEGSSGGVPGGNTRTLVDSQKWEKSYKIKNSTLQNPVKRMKKRRRRVKSAFPSTIRRGNRTLETVTPAVRNKSKEKLSKTVAIDPSGAGAGADDVNWQEKYMEVDRQLKALRISYTAQSNEINRLKLKGRLLKGETRRNIPFISSSSSLVELGKSYYL